MSNKLNHDLVELKMVWVSEREVAYSETFNPAPSDALRYTAQPSELRGREEGAAYQTGIHTVNSVRRVSVTGTKLPTDREHYQLFFCRRRRQPTIKSLYEPNCPSGQHICRILCPVQNTFERINRRLDDDRLKEGL